MDIIGRKFKSEYEKEKKVHKTLSDKIVKQVAKDHLKEKHGIICPVCNSNILYPSREHEAFVCDNCSWFGEHKKALKELNKRG